MNSSSNMIGQSNQNSTTNNNNITSSSRQQQNSDALLAAVKMLRLGTKQISTCKDALDRLQKLLVLPTKLHRQQQQQQNNNNINTKTNPFFAPVTASTSSSLQQQQQHHNSSSNNLLLLASNNSNNNNNNNNTNSILQIDKKLTAAEVRLNRRQFVLNSVGGPGILMNALQVAGNDFGVAEACLSLMVALLVPPDTSGAGGTSSLNSNAFNPLLPRTVKGRARGALRRLVKKFIKKSGTRLVFALLVKHFDSSLVPAYVRGIVFPVCKLIHCFLLGDAKLTATARLSGGLQVLTRIVLAFIAHSSSSSVTNNASSNISLAVPVDALEIIIPGILTTISSLCNVKLSLSALSRNGLGVASLLNLIRNVVVVGGGPNNSGGTRNNFNSTITVQSIVRWSFRLIFNYLVADSSANTKIALENNIVDVCVAVLEQFSTNSSFMQLHCVILDVLTLLLYGTPFPILSECSNNNNNNNNNNRLRASIISPQRERDIIQLVARAACTPTFAPVRKNSPFMEDVSNARDIVDLYNQLTKFLGMTELPIGMDADLVWRSDSPTTACPPSLLKKAGGDSSSDDDENENDDDAAGEGGELAKLSFEERDLVEEFEEKMKRRISLLCPEMNIASSTPTTSQNTSNFSFTIPRETLLRFDSIVDSSSGIVKKVHYSSNLFAESTSSPGSSGGFSIKNPPSWPTANASTENVLPTEPVPDEPLPDDIFRQLARNQFLRLVDPRAAIAQIVFDDLQSRSKQLPEVYSHPPHHHQRIGNSTNKINNNGTNKNSSSSSTSFSLPCLTFDSNFECGNLKRVIRIGDADYDVITSGDTNTERQGQWFYFAVKGMIAGVQYTFRFINAERAGSSFGLGNRPLMFSEKLFDECKNGWLRCGEEIAYFKNSYVKPSSSASVLLLQQQLQQQLLEEGRKGKKKTAKKKEKKNHSNNNVENGNDNNESNEEGDEPTTPAATTKKKSSKSSQQQQQQKKEATIQSLVKPPTTMNTFHVSIRFPYSNDRVFLCPGLPYSYTDLIRYLKYLSISPDSIESTYYTKQQQQNATSYSNNTNNINPGCLMIQTFCDTDSGLPVPILTITQLYKEDPTAAIDLGSGNGNNNTATTASMIMKTPVSAAEMASRPVCVVSARVHPGETVSSFAVKGLIDFLLDPLNPVAKALRQSTVWKIIPMLNPDGVVHGHYRCDLHGYDLNRMFHPQPLAIRTPTVAHLNQLFTHLRISQHRKVVFYGDFHGHSKKTGCFTYGCGSAKKAVHGAIVESIFPAVLHSLLPGFDPEGCTYRVAQGKIATGRVVAYRQHGIRMSYTLEVSLMGGWRFAPTTTCEDDEIIERDAVRNPSAKSLAERKHFKNLALQKLRRNRSDQNNNNNKGEGNDDDDRNHVGEDHDDDDADEYDDNGPELVLHTPQSLCAIGAMFVKAFYCIAENFLSVRAEDLFRVKKPNIVDTQGNIVGTTYEVEALPRRGVVAETAANLLIAHAKLEKQKRIQAMERKILAKNANAKKSNTNAAGGGGTSNKKDLKNNAGATSTPLLPSNSGNFSNNNNNDNLNASNNNNNNNALTQMQKQLSESGLQIPSHFAQEVLAACLNISSSNSNKSSTNSQQQMMTVGSQDNNDVPPPSTPTASITSTSNKKATSKKSLKNTSIVMMQANNNNNNNNNSSSWSVVSSYLQDLLQVTVAWGGKPKEVGIVIGGGGGGASGGGNNNNNNIISTNIHTPLWAASISPGGLIVNSSARTVAMKESYSTRRTPTAFGERGGGGGGSGKINSAAAGGASTTSDGKGKGNQNSSTGGANRKNRKNANNDDGDDDNGGDDADFGEDEDDDDADAGDDDDDEDEDDDDLFDDEDDDDDDDDELADEDDNEDDNNEDEGDEVMNENGDDDQNNNHNNNNNDDDDYDNLNDANFAREDRTDRKFMRSTNPAPGESSRNGNSNTNANNNFNFNNNNNSTTCYRGESSNTSSTTGSFSRKNSSVTPTPPTNTTDDAMIIPPTTPTSSQNNTSFSVKCPPPPRITPKSGNAAVVGTADSSAGTGRKSETTTTVMMKPLMKLPQHPASSSHGIVLRGNNNNNSSSGASTSSTVQQQQPPPPPRQTPCGFGLHKHLNSSRTPGTNTPNNNITVVPSPPPTSNTNNNNSNNSNAQEQLQQQQQPRTTNPNIKYAGSLIRNRETNKK